jgi:hypothetical protein
MRKLIFILFAFLFFGQSLKSQIIAITGTGDQVYLYDDGTWKYVKDVNETASSSSIKINPTHFTKDIDADFQVKSKILDIGVWINAKKWSFNKPSDESASAEYEFRLKGEDAYAMLITERIEVPLNNLKQIALQNAQNVAPDIKIVLEEKRKVNNKEEVLCLQMEGTIQGIKFVYFGYYYSDENGSLQLITYTSSNLFKKYKASLESFLNGLVISKK